mgnify:CR=1 FL=1
MPRLPPLLVALALFGGLFSFPVYSLQVWTCATGVTSDGQCAGSATYQVPTEFLNNDSYVLMSNNLSPSLITYYQSHALTVSNCYPTSCKYIQLKDQNSLNVPLGTSPQFLQTVFPSAIGTYSGGSSGGGSTFNFSQYLTGTDAKEYFVAGLTMVSIFMALGFCYRAILSMLS